MKFDPHVQLERFLKGTQPEREEARQNLLAMEERAIPYVVEQLELEKEREVGFWSTNKALAALAELLADFGSAQVLEPLLDYRLKDSFFRAVQIVEGRGTRADAPALIALLALYDTTPTAFGMDSDSKVIQVAEALVAIAERDPGPEFHAALPLVRVRLKAPMEFFFLHRRLKAALSTDDLPIPAQAIPTGEDLPIPVERLEKESG